MSNSLYTTRELNQRRKFVLETIIANSGKNQKELAEICGMSLASFAKHAHTLEREELVYQTKVGVDRFWHDRY